MGGKFAAHAKVAAELVPEMMSRTATKQELLSLISQGLADAEAAIANHPIATQSLYETGKCAFLDGQRKAEETQWSVRERLFCSRNSP